MAEAEGCGRCVSCGGAAKVTTTKKVVVSTVAAADPLPGRVCTVGGNGYINEYPVGRLWRDAKLYEIGAGTSEIRRMLIGRELFAE